MVPIRARARCADQARANLFISLHANAAPPGVPRGSRRGFEVYVLSPQEREDDASLAGARVADPAGGVWAAHEALALAERSILAAQLISARLQESLGTGASRGVRRPARRSTCCVGRGAPSALIEVGFMESSRRGSVAGIRGRTGRHCHRACGGRHGFRQSLVDGIGNEHTAADSGQAVDCLPGPTALLAVLERGECGPTHEIPQSTWRRRLAA